MEAMQLAQRAVACKHWRWMAGMLTTEDFRVTAIHPDGLPHGEYSQVGPLLWKINAEHMPDLDDPATLGCLLALVRLAQGDCTIWTMLDVDCDEGTWLCTGLEVGEIGSGYSEAHALVAALEAAP